MRTFHTVRAAMSKRPLLAALLVASAILAFTAFAPCFRESGFPFWPDLWCYADSNAPMLFAADGYHYLERAAYALQHGSSGNIPLVSLIAAQCAKILPFSLEWIAFLLPVCFSLALAALALAWGTFLRVSWPARIAGTALCLMVPAWLERSGPGWFDTDPLIAVLWQSIIFCLTILTARQPLPSRPAARTVVAACGLTFCAILLPLVWKPGLGLVALALGVWLVLPPGQGGCPYYGARIRLALLGGMAVAALACVVVPEHLLPQIIASFREYFFDHFSLAFGEKREAFYLSVAELGSLDVWQWLEKLVGSPVGGLVVICAALAAFFAFPMLRFALWLSLPFLTLGFVAERFVYLGAFMPAFCVGLLPEAVQRLYGKPTNKAGRGKTVRPVAVCAVLVCLASCIAWSATRSYDIHWLRPHDTMALRLRDSAPRDAALWNWWDDGYFLRVRTGLAPLFHGGSQTALMADVAARPLSMDNLVAARRWIRFFALRGDTGIDILHQAWGKTALDTLERVFRASDPRTPLAALPSLNRNAAWLFPEGRVFLFLPARFLDISRWWVAAARPGIPAGNHIESLPAADFQYDGTRRAVRPPAYLRDRGYTRFGAILAPDAAPLGPPWPVAPAPYLVYSPVSPRAYITDEIGLRSLALRLFTAGSFPVPGFTPLTVDAAWGGVWEVLP